MAKAKGKPASKPALSIIDRPLLPQQLLALSRVTSDRLLQAARKQVSAGEKYAIDFGVRVSGELIVGHDSSYMGNQVPKSIELVRLLLAQFGPRKRVDIVAEIVADVLRQRSVAAVQQDGGPACGENDELTQLAQHLIDSLTTVAPQSRRGAVTGAVAVSLIEWT